MWRTHSHINGEDKCYVFKFIIILEANDHTYTLATNDVIDTTIDDVRNKENRST